MTNTCLTLKVLQHHIDAAAEAQLARQPRSQTCPVAQALREQFPDASSIGVGVNTAEVITGKDEVSLWGLDMPAQRLIRAFDHDRGKIRPRTITLTNWK